MIHSYSKAIYNIALNFIADRDEAADITQEIFVKVYNNIAKFKEEGNFTSWLLMLSRNYCIDYWRKHKKHMHKVEMDDTIHADAPNPEEVQVKQSEIARLREKMLQLDPDLRLFLTMKDIEDLSYEEIADHLKVPIGTVKSRINRARIKLAQLVVQAGSEHGMSRN